jgi:transposase
MTKEELERFLAEGLSLEQIGKRVGRNPSTVSYHLKKHGLKPVGAKYASKGAIEEELLREMADDGMSLGEMSRELGRSVSTIRRWLRRYELRPPASDRRAEARRARELRLTRVELECIHHGRTTFILESSGYHRCLKCRQARVSEWRRRVKRRLVAEAGGACALCGYDRFVGALHFHHLDPSQKRFALSRQGVTRSFAEAQTEARKYALLCSNCHAEVEGGFSTLPIQSRLAA